MTRTSALAFLLTFALLPVAASPAPESTSAAQEVERLLEQLADRRPQVRESAFKALTNLGVEALPALRRANDHPDPEVRRRVLLLIESKETAARLAPKRINLRVQGKPMRDVVAEVARQTGYKIDYSSEGGDRDKQGFSFDLDNVPFWEGLNKISADGGLVLQSYYRSDGQLTLVARDSHEPYLYHDGVFRVAATGFSYYRNIQFGTLPREGGEGQRSERLSLSLNVTIEPRLRMLGLGSPQLTEAVDDHQNSMLLPLDRNQQTFFRQDGYRSLNLNTQVYLTYPDREARKVRRLRGSIPVTLLMEEKADIVVDKILEVKKQTFKSEATEATIDEVVEEKEGGRKTYKVKLKLRSLTKDAEPGVNYALDQRLELHDAKGNKYRSWGYSFNGGVNEINGTFNFTDFGGGVETPVKLVYYRWVTLQHQLGFEFKDLPLP